LLNHLPIKWKKETNEIFEEIDSLGGVIPAIEAGYFQKEIADAAYKYQKAVENKEKFIVGVNEFIEENENIEIPILTVSPEVQENQMKRLGELKQSRNQKAVADSLNNIKTAAVDNKNLMPVFVEAAQNYVTLGEMIGELKEVFGIYEEVSIF